MYECRYLFAISREVFECWESLNINWLHLIDCSVHLGYDDVIFVCILFTQLLPDGSQFLTVSTPWSIYTWKHPHTHIKKQTINNAVSIWHSIINLMSCVTVNHIWLFHTLIYSIFSCQSETSDKSKIKIMTWMLTLTRDARYVSSHISIGQPLF